MEKMGLEGLKSRKSSILGQNNVILAMEKKKKKKNLKMRRGGT